MIELYLANTKADIDKDIDIAMSYSSLDTSSPEAIKNSFSKSIELKGTETNNNIFANIFNTDRDTVEGDEGFFGYRFDARKRVDFSLYDNGNIIDTGYFCLDAINIKQGIKTYSITLYGILGDVFNNLAQCEDGNALTLSDLKWGFENEDDTILQWDNDYIKTSWEKLNNPDDSIKSKITAVPTYSGTYDDFDNNKILVNHRFLGTHSDYFPDEYIDGRITATTQSDWSIVKADRDLLEWEVRDLRAQYQRPAIKTSFLLDTICKPENNGGYNIVFDDFIKNSYEYKDSWIVLNRMEFSEYDRNIINKYNLNGNVFYSDNNQLSANDAQILDFMTEDLLTIYHNDTNYTANLNISLTAEMELTNTPNRNQLGTVCWCVNGNVLGRYRHSHGLFGTSRVYIEQTMMSGFYIHLFINYPNAQKNTDEIHMFCYSDPFNQLDTYSLVFSNFKEKLAESLGLNTDELLFVNVPIVRTSDKDVKMIIDKTITISEKDFRVQMAAKSCSVYCDYDMDYKWSDTTIRQDNWNSDVALHICYNGGYPSKTSPGFNNFNIKLGNNTNVTSGVYYGNINPENTPTAVNKKILFPQDKSPFQYLTWFTKIINAKYLVDKGTKTINIVPLHKYYIDEVKDISKDIDYARDITINPNTSEYKYYLYNLPTPESYTSVLYDKKNKTPYAGYNVDTKYEFNKDTNDVFSDCIYTNAIPFKISSVLLNEISNVPSVALLPSFEHMLWNRQNGDEVTEKRLGYTGNANIKLGRVYDAIPKLCCMDEDLGNVDDCENIFVYFNGFYKVEDAPYRLTNNLRIMRDLNDNNNCYIYSRYEDYNNGGYQDNNAIKIIDSIPIFNKCKEVTDGLNSEYVSSFNFAKPEYTFINDAGKYHDGITLYDKYWKSYLSDIYDKNAKKVECYIRLKDNPNEALRKFYVFGNSMWIITNIEDYSYNSNDLTKVTFIKVNSKANYLGYGGKVNETYTTTETDTTTAP